MENEKARVCFEDHAFRRVSAAYFNHYVHGFPHPDRVMEEHDLIYMCEGEWEIWLPGGPVMLRRDQVLILPARVHHYGKKACPDHTKTMFLHVSAAGDRFLTREPSGREAPAREERNKGEIALRLLTDCRDAGNVRALFERVTAEFASGHDYRESRISALLQLLLTELYAAQNQNPGEAADGLVETVTRIIREDPGHFHTVQELASLLYVSPRTVSGRFKKRTGVTLHQYELDMKLRSAAAFIREYPDVKLYEVAKNFGFYDEFHFSRAFSGKFSIPPAAYRRRKKEGNAP